MINISMLVDHVKSRFGVSHRKIELDDEAIVNCLVDTTLKTLSIYAPYYCTLKLNLAQNEVMPGMNTYFVPEVLGDEFTVMSIEQAFPTSGSNVMSSGAAGATFFMPAGTDIQNIITSLAAAKFANMMQTQAINPFTFEYLPPNMIRFNHNMSTSDMMLIARTTHRKDFSTFPFGMLDTIKELAFYDVALDIYSIRRHFSNMRTLFAEINLDMEMFNGIPAERREFIANLRKNQLRYSATKKIYVV